MKKQEDYKYYFSPPQEEIGELAAKRNAAIWKRAGHDSIIMRLIDIGCFNDPNRTPIESVRSVDTPEALRIISLKNAGL